MWYLLCDINSTESHQVLLLPDTHLRLVSARIQISPHQKHSGGSGELVKVWWKEGGGYQTPCTGNLLRLSLKSPSFSRCPTPSLLRHKPFPRSVGFASSAYKLKTSWAQIFSCKTSCPQSHFNPQLCLRLISGGKCHSAHSCFYLQNRLWINRLLVINHFISWVLSVSPSPPGL